MNRIDNILVIVDPTASEHPAIDKAALIAQKFKSRIELFACETQQSRAMRYATHVAKGSTGEFVTHLRSPLETLAHPLRAKGMDVTLECAIGDPLHTELIKRSRQTNADLVVKDTHHHSLIQRTLITNTDWHLIRECPVPLLLTKTRPWAQTPTIVAAVDPGHVNDKPVVLDNRILEWARALHDRTQGDLFALHAHFPLVLAAEVSGGVPMMSAVATTGILEDERVAKWKEVESLVAPYGIDAKHVIVQLGVASDVLPRTAEEIKADLLVMGAISRSGLQRLFIGSTAERVLERVPCDILVVKPHDFATDQAF